MEILREERKAAEEAAAAASSVVAPEGADSKSSKSESPARGDDSNESTSVEELKGGAGFSFDDLEAAQ